MIKSEKKDSEQERLIAHYAAWLVLSNVKEFDYEAAIEILRIFGSLDKAVFQEAMQLISVPGPASPISVGSNIEKIIEQGRQFAKQKDYYRIVESILRKGIEILPMIGQKYPRVLHELENPPRTLFVKGCLPQDFDKSIAIVGTRSPSPYGKK